jgi:chromatin remodeling complex protein RSC6
VEVSAPAEGGASEDANLSGTQLIISKMQTQIAELTTQLHASTGALKTLTTAMKSLEKEYAKERKELLKKAEKHTRKTKSNRNPSGFAKSSPISDELADFLGLPKGSELARTEATRRINAYIKANNLQNPDAKTIILPDAKLKALLAPPEGAVVKYFNLQSFLKRHFGTASTPVVNATA